MFNPKRRLEKRSKVELETGTDEMPDFTEKVPKDVLSHILTFLPLDESIRSGILSKKWKDLWRITTHIELDEKKLIKPLSQLLISRKSRKTKDVTKGASRYALLLYRIMSRHYGNLLSFRILHLWKSLLFGEVKSWVEHVLTTKKGVQKLSLECEPDNGEMGQCFLFKDNIPKLNFSNGIFQRLDSLEMINYNINCSNAFVGCKNLKTLKLKKINLDDGTINDILNNCVVLENFTLNESTGFNKLIIMIESLKVLKLQGLCVDELKVSCENLEVLLLDSITCPTNTASIYAPNLKTFSSYYYSLFGNMHAAKEGYAIVKGYEILAHSALVYSSNIIFKNLSTLSMDLDLNHIRDAQDLYSVFQLCTSLQVLEISLPDFENTIIGSSNDYDFPYPISMFWEKQELCYCVHEKLKFVYIKAFKGNELEVEFVKYLIAKATMMKKVTIFCNTLTEDAENLLSLPKTSTNLSINFKVNAINIMN
ncbi:PREDICTED: F-box protein At1g80960-like [Lupinus angustifolius]|uniref:F-box protein At1g80960-like n=1 Tax=Lupinus angustifolius TaxID=3871 RepID=UPI00092F76EF|nr:PREDICTED: F-box protein At1g80960-like [Lupinus angustifolius]